MFPKPKIHRKVLYIKRSNPRLNSHYISTTKSFNFTMAEFLNMEYTPREMLTCLINVYNSFKLKNKKRCILTNGDEFFIATPYILGRISYYVGDNFYCYFDILRTVFYPTVSTIAFFNRMTKIFKFTELQVHKKTKNSIADAAIIAELKGLKDSICQIFENYTLNELMEIENRIEVDIFNDCKQIHDLLTLILQKKNLMLLFFINVDSKKKIILKNQDKTLNDFFNKSISDSGVDCVTNVSFDNDDGCSTSIAENNENTNNNDTEDNSITNKITTDYDINDGNIFNPNVLGNYKRTKKNRCANSENMELTTAINTISSVGVFPTTSKQTNPNITGVLSCNNTTKNKTLVFPKVAPFKQDSTISSLRSASSIICKPNYHFNIPEPYKKNMQFTGAQISSQMLQVVYSGVHLQSMLNSKNLKLDNDIKVNQQIKGVYNIFICLFKQLGSISFDSSNSTLYLVYGFLNLTRAHIRTMLANLFIGEKKKFNSGILEHEISNTYLGFHRDIIDLFFSKCDSNRFNLLLDDYFQNKNSKKQPSKYKNLDRCQIFSQDMLEFFILKDVTNGLYTKTSCNKDAKIQIDQDSLMFFFKFMFYIAFALFKTVFVYYQLINCLDISRMTIVDEFIKDDIKFLQFLEENPAEITKCINSLTYESINVILKYYTTTVFNFKEGVHTILNFYYYLQNTILDGALIKYNKISSSAEFALAYFSAQNNIYNSINNNTNNDTIFCSTDLQKKQHFECLTDISANYPITAVNGVDIIDTTNDSQPCRSDKILADIDDIYVSIGDAFKNFNNNNTTVIDNQQNQNINCNINDNNIYNNLDRNNNDQNNNYNFDNIDFENIDFGDTTGITQILNTPLFNNIN